MSNNIKDDIKKEDLLSNYQEDKLSEEEKEKIKSRFTSEIKRNLRIAINFSKSLLDTIDFCYANNVTVNFSKDKDGNNNVKLKAEGIEEINGNDFQNVVSKAVINKMRYPVKSK